MRPPTLIASVCALFGVVSSSAIPMWEFLSKNEKVSGSDVASDPVRFISRRRSNVALALQMSYLYNMFENQVHETCGTSQCKQELLKYGLTKLKTMSEEALDKMDPYQRGSGDISKF